MDTKDGWAIIMLLQRNSMVKYQRMSNNLTNEYAAWLSENQEEVDHSAHVANLEKHYGTDQFQHP
jgi:hypothetical protein